MHFFIRCQKFGELTGRHREFGCRFGEYSRATVECVERHRYDEMVMLRVRPQDKLPATAIGFQPRRLTDSTYRQRQT